MNTFANRARENWHDFTRTSETPSTRKFTKILIFKLGPKTVEF